MNHSIFKLTKENLKNIYSSKEENITGAGALFIGTPKQVPHPVMYTVFETGNQALTDLGGKREDKHHNSLHCMIDEVYEESCCTLYLSYHENGELYLNHKIPLHDRGVAIDTVSPKGIYRCFIFNVGKDYKPENGFSAELFLRNRKRLLKMNISSSFLETSRVHHIPLLFPMTGLSWLKDMNGDSYCVRKRTKRILKALFKN